MPVLVLVVSVGFVAVFDPFGKWTFNPPNLTLILNAIFLTGTGIVVAAISARSYLRQGNFNILLLGSAVLVSGLASLAAGRVLSVQTPNYSVTIHNVGFLVSSILQIISAALIFSGTRTIGFTKRKFALAVSYSVMVFLVISLTVLTLLGLTPTFFVEGGPTLLRQAVVGTTIILFTLSCLVLFRSYLLLKSRVLFWYSLSLGLFAIGFLSLTLQIYAGDGFSWVSKFAQYTGGFYFILAVLSTRTKDSSTGLSENWAEAFRSDRKQVAAFFSKLSEGFAYCKIIGGGAEEKEGADFVYLDVNEAFETMMGKTRSEILGKKNSEIQPQMSTDPEARNVLQLYAKVALTGESKRFERYSKFVDKWFNILVYSPSKGYFALLLEDITERKKAEEALRESDLRLRFHTENTPLAVVEWDSNFVVTRWAGDAEKMFGWSESETLGKPIMSLNLIYEPDTPIVEKTMNRLTSGETKVVSSNRNITKDGRVIYCTWYNSVLLNEKGKMASVFSFVEDNTTRVRAEKALEDTNRNLEKLVEERTKQLKDAERLAAIGATAGMVGHDIRNPLQAITSDVYLAKTDLASTPESEEKKNVLESLQEIEKNVDYVNKIVADLQDFARPIAPKIEETDLEQTIHSVLARLDIPGNVTVKHSVGKDFPKLEVDPAYLQRILTNLANNAIQAMPKGGKLAINAVIKDGKVIISVEDNGEGIPESVRSKLFTPLVTTKSRGQGFGLSVVKRFTEGMGGTVTFESEVGKGTKFIIELPL